jgi:hypothetical protein
LHQTGMDPGLGGFDSSWLVGTTVTGDGHGWYGDGASTASGRSLLIRVLCLPAAKLNGAELRQKTTLIEPRESAVTARAKCPKRDELITGGAFVHQENAGPNAASATHARLSASFPSARAWVGGVRGFVPFPLDEALTVYAICLPERKVAEVHQRRFADTVGPGVTFFSTYDCKRREASLGGGAYFHKRRKPFNSGLKRGNLAGQIPVLPSGSGWLTAGINYTYENLRLTTRIVCVE